MNDNDHEGWEELEPEELKMALQNIRNRPLPVESLQKAIDAAESISMTPQAWKRGFLNAFLVGVPMCVLVATIAYWLTTRFGVNKLVAISSVYLILWLVCLGWMLVNHFRMKSRVGRVLVDCGRAPGRAMFLLQTGLMVGMAMIFLADGSIFEAIIFLSLSIYWSYLSTSRLQICEGGIKLHGLLPWSKIKSYQWKEGKTSTLLVQTSAILSWYSRGAYPIPVKHRDEVDAVLTQKVGKTSTDSAS